MADHGPESEPEITCRKCGSTEIRLEEGIEPTFGELVPWVVCTACGAEFPAPIFS